MANVIEISGLVKDFGSTRALDGLDLTVEEGDVHGFLGPNGSGKSTTIRILLGLLRPNGGQATLFGKDPWRDATSLHEHISYVPGDVSLWPQLTGGEVIDLLARLRGDLDPKRRDELIERFELDPRKKTRTYSKGNRQKVALVAGLASDAELLLLDEPTSGLDPLMEGEFQKCVREMRDEGRTILLSSHILAEVEALCETVSIIRLGKTVQTGSLDQLRGLTHTAVIATTREPLDGVGDLTGVTIIDHHNHTVRLDVESEHLEEAFAFLSARKLTSLESHPPTLEELFLRSYGDTIPEQDE